MTHFHEAVIPRTMSTETLRDRSVFSQTYNKNFAYFTSVTRNSTSTDKREADGALILYLSLH